jgi:hypothetical protein
MKCRKITHLGSFVLAVIIAAGLSGTVPRAYGEESPDTSAYELCIEQSPAKAGKVSPDSGTHRFSANSIVALSAEPQQGYQFAYWLGDVADPKSQHTTVQVNAPKVIVAVFRPADEDPFEKEIGGGGGGGSALLPTATDLSAPGWSPSGGGGKTRTQTVFVPVIPTPEPATIMLLGLGTLALRRRTPRA